MTLSEILLIAGIIILVIGTAIKLKNGSPDTKLVIGIALIVVGTASGTYLIHRSNRDANTKRIFDLEESFTSQNEQLQTITNRLKDEQREKGNLKLNVGKYDSYFARFGNIVHKIDVDDSGKTYQGEIQQFSYGVKIKNGEFLLTIMMKDRDGRSIFLMNEGMWALSKVDTFSVNFDDNGIEIVGKFEQILLQIDIVKNQFKITGTFYNQDGVTLVTPNYNSYISNDDKNYKRKLDNHFKRIKPIFKHYGENFLGKRVNNE